MSLLKKIRDLDITHASKVFNWLQAIGGFGVLAGLLLVAYQIKQNTDLVHAQLNSDAWNEWIAIDASKQGGDFATTLAKSIESPESLTMAEVLELDGYLFTYVDQLSRDRELYELGVFDAPLHILVAESAHDYFGNKFARVWWEETKWKFRSDVVAAIDKEIPSILINQDIEYFRRIKQKVAEVKD